MNAAGRLKEELVHALLGGDLSGAMAALDRGAALNEGLDANGDTPLHMACRLGHADLIRTLLARGAVQRANDNGVHPIQFLMERADSEAELDCLEALLENKPGCVNDRDRSWVTPLHLAMGTGHLAVIRRLLDAGADVNACDDQGYTPLTFGAAAYCHDDPRPMELLLNRGADVHAANEDGCTAIHLATAHRAPHVTRFLLGRGALATQTDRDGNTPLHTLASGVPNASSDFEKCREIIQALLAEGATIDAKTPLQFQALHKAATENQEGPIRALVAEGADVNAIGGQGFTPLHCASMDAADKAVATLLELGADPDQQDFMGNTAEVRTRADSEGDVVKSVFRAFRHAAELAQQIPAVAGGAKPRM